jgi:hypothetical protein
MGEPESTWVDRETSIFHAKNIADYDDRIAESAMESIKGSQADKDDEGVTDEFT